MDITTEGFGFMLAFGDLVWVPFTYSLQARFIATRPEPIGLPIPALVGIVALNMIGYVIFRQSNSEKDAFRNGKMPNAKVIKTSKPGRNLLVEVLLPHPVTGPCRTRRQVLSCKV